MPTSWQGRVITAVYSIGYTLYLIFVGVVSWPTLGFWDWSNFLTWHSFIGLGWPVAFVLWWVGYFP